jgi:type IV secretory pathway TraG/TraD family ATPase VirD4
VFLWSDEAQDLVIASDAAFQAKARSARACTVYLTQSVPSYTKSLGAAATDTLLGNLQTKIFHANGDPQTNAWAEKLFGHETRHRHSRSQTTGSFVNESQTVGTSESREPRIEAAEFTLLKKGGDGVVEAIVFQAGKTWKASGKNYLRTKFPQEGAK